MLSNVIFWAAIALIVLGAFVGLLRGFARSFLRCFTVLLAFVSSALLCTSFIGDPERLLKLSFVERLIQKVPLLRDLTEAMPELAPLALSLPTAMFAPLVFLIVFLVLSGLLLLVYGIVAAFVLPKNGKRNVFAPLSHVLGAAVGAVQGAVVTLAILIPIVGMADLTVEIVDTVKAESGEYRVEAIERLAPYRDELLAVKESEVYGFAEKFGGRAICDALMQYELSDGDGETTKVDLRHETLVLARLYAHSFPLQGTAPAKFGEKQAAALSVMADDLASSELLSRVIAGFLAGASGEWKEGDAFLGIKPFTMQGELSTLPPTLYGALCDSNAETVRIDLATLSQLVGLLDEHGLLEVLGDGDALLERATEGDALAEITACLEANPRTKAVADELRAIAFRAFRREFLSAISETDPAYGAYRDMLETVASAVNGLSPDASPEEQLAALAPELEEALAEYGIAGEELSSPILNAAADTVLDGLGTSIGDVTADDIAALLAYNGSAE